MLHVADLVEAFEAVRQNRKRAAGQIYNVGGGMERSVSVVEVLENIRAQLNLSDLVES